MSTLGFLWSGVKTVAGFGLKLIGVKPVAGWPTLDGAQHRYPIPGDREYDELTWYESRSCLKCGKYNDRKALVTDPRCAERFPKVIVELP